MKWEPPISLKSYVGLVIGTTTVAFILGWMGYGNQPGPGPIGWGDLIPFADAVQQLPGIFIVMFAGVGLYVLFSQGNTQLIVNP